MFDKLFFIEILIPSLCLLILIYDFTRKSTVKNNKEVTQSLRKSH